ncbi:protein-disulfide isomerase [Halovivax ruber XH-70]|uniref:Protein-disulfide isomerase n=1 Tax=Halovivax ruber (strain DSM 18193 / JCM 13892 / XH-70) TaxID=797302 RepID=L0IDM1_HALRX|nr:thioredoxin domain-containing protein [Halovivax ruber]AGB16301.1 protein-disulfide isomerase [Halovivax ruber XH-70]
MNRRHALAGIASASTLSVAGCLGGLLGSGGVQDLPDPTLGQDDAPVTVEVWEDFSCGHCKTFDQEVYPQLVENYVDPGDIRYVFHDFPIPVHDRWSWDVSEAARVVQDNADDSDAFWTFKDRMFENQGAYSEDVLSSAAGEVGVDGDSLLSDVSDDRYRPVVETAKEDGTDMGVRGTPAIFVEGEGVDSPTYNAVANAIERNL